MPIRHAVAVTLLSVSTLLAGSAAQAQAASVSAPVSAPASAPASAPELPAWLRRGLPNAGHEAIASLAGTWKVRMGVYATLGRSPDAPPLVTDDMVTRREWVGGGRYLEDTTEGTLEGHRYWRRGWLGYNTMDRAYEWVTIDASNAVMMIYAAPKASGPQRTINLFGSFTDQGVSGEAYAGKSVGMRTLIRIESPDRHTIELYLTPPGAREQLATRAVYVRATPS